MRKTLWALFNLTTVGFLCSGAEISTFPAYIDSDLCARLMLGPITDSRKQCSQQTFKQGSNPVVIRLKDNIVLTANKEKMLKEHVGTLAEVSGETKQNAGTIKLASVTAQDVGTSTEGDAGRKVLYTRTVTPSSPKTFEKVRHELAMMPYVSNFDFISFTMTGSDVILTGWSVRETNRSEAFDRVKSIEGVENVTNNIEALPLGSNDMQIRAASRAALQRFLPRYFWSSGSDIKIVVKNGNIILLGAVASKADSDLATIQCNSVPLAFHVFNMLQIRTPQKG